MGGEEAVFADRPRGGSGPPGYVKAVAGLVAGHPFTAIEVDHELRLCPTNRCDPAEGARSVERLAASQSFLESIGAPRLE